MTTKTDSEAVSAQPNKATVNFDMIATRIVSCSCLDVEVVHMTEWYLPTASSSQDSTSDFQASENIRDTKAHQEGEIFKASV